MCSTINQSIILPRIEDKINNSKARFLQRVIVQSLANSLAVEKNCLADLLSGKITHDVFNLWKSIYRKFLGSSNYISVQDLNKTDEKVIRKAI